MAAGAGVASGAAAGAEPVTLRTWPTEMTFGLPMVPLFRLNSVSQLVPNFEALYVQEGRDWPRFYDAAKRLAKLSRPQRMAALEALVPAGTMPAAAAMIEP